MAEQRPPLRPPRRSTPAPRRLGDMKATTASPAVPRRESGDNARRFQDERRDVREISARRLTEDRRFRWAQVITVVLVCVLVGRLAQVQFLWGSQLSAKAEAQRTFHYTDPARRGEITDRDGRRLAYTMQARSLTINPHQFRHEEAERQEYKLRSGQVDGASTDAEQKKAASDYAAMTPEQQRTAVNDAVKRSYDTIAEDIPRIISDRGASTDKVSSAEIRRKFDKDSRYEVLVSTVDPDVATEIAKKYPGVAADRQDIRNYPNGAIAENVLGKISSEGYGQYGFELYANDLLSGVDGSSTEELSSKGQVIPGSLRDVKKAVNGVNIELTLDLELQTYVQQQVQQAKEMSKAKGAQAVVLDSATGEVLAMANSDTIDPRGNIGAQEKAGKSFNNPAISTPFEPGSVAKVITASAAIDNKLTTPDEVFAVPGSIEMAGVRVHDAWPHGTVGFTTTGIFSKSSNVGTLMLAQRVGEDRFADYLHRFGLGTPTGIELPSETAGLVPDRHNWGGGTFANLPIGQGMAISLLQMTSVYQTIANDGERIEPRIVKKKVDADGRELPLTVPKTERVMSAEAARTVRNMFRGVVQGHSGGQSGTAPGAAIEGYQISGKTGTAQQVNRETGAYSNSDYWITFAGIAPADNPRFVVGIMLDDPQRGVHGGAGGTAAPLFKDIASWLLARDGVPPSPPMEGPLLLQTY